MQPSMRCTGEGNQQDHQPSRAAMQLSCSLLRAARLCPSLLELGFTLCVLRPLIICPTLVSAVIFATIAGNAYLNELICQVNLIPKLCAKLWTLKAATRSTLNKRGIRVCFTVTSTYLCRSTLNKRGNGQGWCRTYSSSPRNEIALRS